MKTIFKLSILGAASVLAAASVHAEDSYNFFGTLDLGYYKGFDDKSQLGSISRSNLGFAANKDLSADLAATAKINTRFFFRNPVNGDHFVNEDPKYLGSGEATVGLKGNYGHLRVGRSLTALRSNDWAFDAWGNYDIIASPAWYLWNRSAADPNNSSTNVSYLRLNNGAFYASPVFAGGFSVDASYGTRSEPLDTRHSASLAVKYNQKDYGLMYGHEKTPVGNTINFVGGKVNFGNLSVMAAYNEDGPSNGDKLRSTTLSGRYTAGSMSYMLGFGHDIGNTALPKSNFYSAGASYAYKPNTNLYVSYGNARDARTVWQSTSQAKDAIGVGVNYSF